MQNSYPEEAGPAELKPESAKLRARLGAVGLCFIVRKGNGSERRES